MFITRRVFVSDGHLLPRDTWQLPGVVLSWALYLVGVTDVSHAVVGGLVRMPFLLCSFGQSFSPDILSYIY